MDEFRVAKCPDTVLYIPNFITENEEKYLYDSVYKAPKTKWTVLSNRRLQNWGGLPHPKGMVQEKLPQWLTGYCERLQGLKIFGDFVPNHVLINEYKPGQGIMPHEDGPLYYPTVSTLSLGSHTILEIYDLHDRESEAVNVTPKSALLLERRSLLVLRDSMYTAHLHGISEITSDILENDVPNVDSLGDEVLKQKLLSGECVTMERDTRVSLTIRYVPKVLKLNLQLGNGIRKPKLK